MLQTIAYRQGAVFLPRSVNDVQTETDRAVSDRVEPDSESLPVCMGNAGLENFLGITGASGISGAVCVRFQQVCGKVGGNSIDKLL